MIYFVLNFDESSFCRFVYDRFGSLLHKITSFSREIFLYNTPASSVFEQFLTIKINDFEFCARRLSFRLFTICTTTEVKKYTLYLRNNFIVLVFIPYKSFVLRSDSKPVTFSNHLRA